MGDAEIQLLHPLPFPPSTKGPCLGVSSTFYILLGDEEGGWVSVLSRRAFSFLEHRGAVSLDFNQELLAIKNSERLGSSGIRF